MTPIRFVTADDHAIFRKGVQSGLESDTRFQFQGEAGNGLELLRLLASVPADVVLLDSMMPGMDGYQTALQLRERYPQVAIIMLTMQDNRYALFNLMETGVSAILLKGETDFDEIKSAMLAVTDTGYFFNAHLNPAVFRAIATSRLPKGFQRPYQKLSGKELAILPLFCQGLTTEQIASRVFMSIRSIERVRSGLFEKTGASNTIGLVVFAMRAGLYQ